MIYFWYMASFGGGLEGMQNSWGSINTDGGSAAPDNTTHKKATLPEKIKRPRLHERRNGKPSEEEIEIYNQKLRELKQKTEEIRAEMARLGETSPHYKELENKLESEILDFMSITSSRKFKNAIFEERRESRQ